MIGTYSSSLTAGLVLTVFALLALSMLYAMAFVTLSAYLASIFLASSFSLWSPSLFDQSTISRLLTGLAQLQLLPIYSMAKPLQVASMLSILQTSSLVSASPLAILLFKVCNSLTKPKLKSLSRLSARKHNSKTQNNGLFKKTLI